MFVVCCLLHVVVIVVIVFCVSLSFWCSLFVGCWFSRLVCVV